MQGRNSILSSFLYFFLMTNALRRHWAKLSGELHKILKHLCTRSW